jgi:uncharacterized integral membrane protein
MSSPYYKRRKRSWVRNLWIYRRLVALAALLGVVLWFILINRDPVTVTFPFRLGQIAGTSGIVILFGACAGSLVTLMILAVYLALRHRKDHPEAYDRDELSGDRPPSDYASKTGEGFSDAPWTKG